ncbi:MAG: hypothetical protein QXK37_01195 [Candidatus Woesearchaeota archaeon]
MLALFRSNGNIWFSVWNNSTSNPYIVPECAYAVDANTLFERCLFICTTRACLSLVKCLSTFFICQYS